MGKHDDDGFGLGGILMGLGALAGAGYAAYRAFKGKKEKEEIYPQISDGYDEEIIYGPEDYSDILNCREDYISPLHTIRARMIPLLATFFSKSGNIDIRGNEEEIRQYADRVRKSFQNENIQTKKIKRFIVRSIEEASEYNIDSIIAYVKEFLNYLDENYSDTSAICDELLFESLFLTKTINDGMTDSMIAFGKALGRTPENVIQVAIDAGYANYFRSNSAEETCQQEPAQQNDTEYFHAGKHGEKPTIYYLAIIGLDENATWEDVLEAKKSMLLLLHPDNFNGNEKKRLQAEERSKMINIAVDELKRRKK